MKKIILLFILIQTLIFVENVSAQTFLRTYSGTPNDYVDRAYFMQQTSDSGFIVAGSTGNFFNNINGMYLVKSNAYGSTEWQAAYGGSASNDFCYTAQQTSDGGYILAGTIETFGGVRDISLLKTNSAGAISWSKVYSTTSDDVGYCVQQTTDGGYIIGGWTAGAGAGGTDFILIKTNSSGDTTWSRTFGGQFNELCYCVRQTTDGGYLAVGSTESFGAGSKDVYLVKVTSTGNYSWSMTYGVGGGDDWGNKVIQNSDGDYVIVGFTYGVAAERNALLIVTDGSGGLIWARSYGVNNWDEGYDVKQLASGEYILTGITDGYGAGTDRDAFLIKTNSGGQLLWARGMGGGGVEEGHSVAILGNGYALAGWSNSFSTSYHDVILFRTDLSGMVGCNDTLLALPDSSITLSSSMATTLINAGGIEVAAGTLLSGNGGMENYICSTGPNANDVLQENFSVYPNPVSSSLTVSTNIKINCAISIIDLLGREMWSVNSAKEITEVDVSSFPKGVYFLNIISGEKILIQKILVY